MTAVASSAHGAAVVPVLRRARRLHRLGELEWFDVAYRVYLAALVGGAVVAWLSGLVTDEAASPGDVRSVLEHGPTAIGLGAAIAVALGLRSGSDGGPVSIEQPDVRHLLLAPIPRRAVLLRPVVQRLRATSFGAALAGALAGQLAARRLPGSIAAWMTSGAVAGAAMGALFVAVAVITHVLIVPRWVATGLALCVVGAQVAALAVGWPGPADTIGSSALWGMRQRGFDLLGLGVVVALVAVAVLSAGRLVVEPLVRRGDLVSQLRFAVTMQDLRTVVLLRRQLRNEHPRATPWVTWGGHRTAKAGRPTSAVWQRGWRGLVRYPLARLTRMALLTVVAAIGVVLALHDTTPALIITGLALHLLGLDAVEPLSQEIDRPDHTDSMPCERGWLMLRHLAAPAIGLVPVALAGAAVVSVLEPDTTLATLALCVPVMWAGVCGAVVSIVRDAPDPVSSTPMSAAMPPEVAGFSSSIKLVYPVIVSIIGTAPVLAMREFPTVGTAARSIAGVALLVALTGLWVRRRDRWKARWREFVAGAQAHRTASS